MFPRAMITPNRLIVCALALMVSGGGLVRAGELGPEPAAGRVLVLANERTLEGDIERAGNQYRIRRATGETWIPAEKALRLCSTREEAYAYLRTRANLRDPDERVRLARWCLLYGMRGEALEEVKAAVEVRPSHLEAQRLLRNLQSSMASPPPPRSPVPPEPSGEVSNPVSLDCPPEALSLFTTKVQPILMNTCASCHAGGRGGNFKLTRVFTDSPQNSRATQQNLAAALAQVHRDTPAASPLLAKAITVHGDAEQPPLKGRQTPAYRTLEEWVERLVGDSRARAVATAAVPMPSRTFSEVASSRPQSETVAAPVPPAATPPPPEPLSTAQPSTLTPVPPKTAPQSPPAAAAPTEPVDLFDPVLFNRQMHPQKQ
jgi:hypothetical protein